MTSLFCSIAFLFLWVRSRHLFCGSLSRSSEKNKAETQFLMFSGVVSTIAFSINPHDLVSCYNLPLRAHFSSEFVTAIPVGVAIGMKKLFVFKTVLHCCSGFDGVEAGRYAGCRPGEKLQVLASEFFDAREKFLLANHISVQEITGEEPLSNNIIQERVG